MRTSPSVVVETVHVPAVIAVLGAVEEVAEGDLVEQHAVLEDELVSPVAQSDQHGLTRICRQIERRRDPSRRRAGNTVALVLAVGIMLVVTLPVRPRHAPSVDTET